MKKRIAISICCFLNILALSAAHANADKNIAVVIRDQQAKDIYNLMTGPDVVNDGAAGHLYRIGKSITCVYTNVEMNDKRGRVIPMQDPRHYVCKMEFNNNGLATPKQ